MKGCTKESSSFRESEDVNDPELVVYNVGVNHFGFQAADKAELGDLRQRADLAGGAAILDEGETSCCYAQSEKHWVTDPSGMPWEHYHTMAQIQSHNLREAEVEPSRCCVPKVSVGEECC